MRVQGRRLRSSVIPLLVLVLAGATASVYGAEGTTGSGSGASSSGTLTVSEDYIIQLDDVLTIDDGKARSELNPNRSYKVAEDGTIKLLYLGRVKAAGLTVRQLEDNIEKLYDPKYFKNLYIDINVASKTYDIGGEVRSPGIKNLLMRTTILKAIASAGWFTDYAKVSKVTVTRDEGGKTVLYEVDCGKIMKGEAEDAFVIKANDTIIVPRSGAFGL
jgi:protein involved in polysaccharide export with SLBB domain